MKLEAKINWVMQTLVKITGAVSLISCLLIFTHGTTLAQNELADYQFQYEQYRKLYPQFTRARDSFLQHQTLTSQEEAIDLTKQLMLQRAQVMRTYLLLLRRRLRSAPDIIIEARTQLNIVLDQEIEWLDEHMKNIQTVTTPTLGDLLGLSDRFERRHNLWRALSYETRARILLGKTRQVQNEAVTINGLLEDYVLQQDPQEQARFKNWLDETKNGAYQSQKFIENAELVLLELTGQSGDPEGTVQAFTQLQTSLESGQQALLKVVNFQKEIINTFEVNNNEG